MITKMAIEKIDKLIFNIFEMFLASLDFDNHEDEDKLRVLYGENTVTILAKNYYQELNGFCFPSTWDTISSPFDVEFKRECIRGLFIRGAVHSKYKGNWSDLTFVVEEVNVNIIKAKTVKETLKSRGHLAKVNITNFYDLLITVFIKSEYLYEGA